MLFIRDTLKMKEYRQVESKEIYITRYFSLIQTETPNKQTNPETKWVYSKIYSKYKFKTKSIENKT